VFAPEDLTLASARLTWTVWDRPVLVDKGQPSVSLAIGSLRSAVRTGCGWTGGAGGADR